MSLLKSIVAFYLDGFRSMTLGRTLWVIILIKLFIIFVVVRILFYPKQLEFKNDRERANYFYRQYSR